MAATNQNAHELTSARSMVLRSAGGVLVGVCVGEASTLSSLMPTGESGGTKFLPPHFGHSLRTLDSLQML